MLPGSRASWLGALRAFWGSSIVIGGPPVDAVLFDVALPAMIEQCWACSSVQRNHLSEGRNSAVRKAVPPLLSADGPAIGTRRRRDGPGRQCRAIP